MSGHATSAFDFSAMPSASLAGAHSIENLRPDREVVDQSGTKCEGFSQSLLHILHHLCAGDPGQVFVMHGCSPFTKPRPLGVKGASAATQRLATCKGRLDFKKPRKSTNTAERSRGQRPLTKPTKHCPQLMAGAG